MTFRLPQSSLALIALLSLTGGLAAQAPTAPLRAALTTVGENLSTLQIARWKLPNAGKDETQENLDSIHRDLESTLLPLLNAADAEPTMVSAQLPVSSNISALYDVLLRVVERSKGTAPADQAVALERSRASLETARRSFDDSILSAAILTESRFRQLSDVVHKLQSTPPPAPAPPPPATTKRKPKAKPAAAQPSAQPS